MRASIRLAAVIAALLVAQAAPGSAQAHKSHKHHKKAYRAGPFGPDGPFDNGSVAFIGRKKPRKDKSETSYFGRIDFPQQGAYYGRKKHSGYSAYFDESSIPGAVASGRRRSGEILRGARRKSAHPRSHLRSTAAASRYRQKTRTHHAAGHRSRYTVPPLPSVR
ncbi:MAG TPA: hypothetical protein VGS41_09760 [Chthonomonadales bacterium]|nr:hypothetical protein [Chthonomonadales bacterium]